VKKETLKNTEDKAECEQCGQPQIEFKYIDNLCPVCITETLADSIEETVDSEYINVNDNIKMCSQCCEWNYINWWWYSESLNRWVCYGCGMGRSREYQRDQEVMKKYYEAKSKTPTSTH
jgi:hypothetical protein